ncbi:MAG: FRG domain-containing protein [Proteobacteria bacterium]|nr:MAG: FRG domain-containing protein [Pseudomonadota bacterium]
MRQDQILDARFATGCQTRSAWFRGLSNTSHQLTPSLFRNGRATTESILRDAEISNRIIYKKDMESVKCALNNAVSSHKLSMQNRKALSKLISFIERRYEIVSANYINNEEKKSDLKKIEVLISNGMAAILSEIDAFHEFKNRGHFDALSSWDVLAQMRHRAVPTRLLDWTESCHIAMHFALKQFMDRLIPSWSQREWTGRYPDFPNVKGMPEPAIWIMNPFHLADLSGIQGAIPYPNHPPLEDYYASFLVNHSWPYKKPIPIRAPRTDVRMESQRGNFTVHGFDVRPLEKQISSGKADSCLIKIEISRQAAVYGTYYLWQFAHHDEFELMRDSDTLGKVVTERHFNY